MNMLSPEQVFASASFPDQEHPDAEILDAYEKVRAFRSWCYSFDGLHRTDPAAWDKVREITDAGDDEQQRFEDIIYGEWATTPSGVAAQLCLNVTASISRWVDIGLMEHGIRALYEQREELEGNDCIYVIAAYELIHIEWHQALATWEAAYSANERFLTLKSRVDSEHYARTDEPVFAPDTDVKESAFDLAERLQAKFCDDDCRALDRLLATLAPDWAAYHRKAEIAIKQLKTEDAAPWLIRDVNFLTGQIKVPAEDGE